MTYGFRKSGTRQPVQPRWRRRGSGVCQRPRFDQRSGFQATARRPALTTKLTNKTSSVVGAGAAYAPYLPVRAVPEEARRAKRARSAATTASPWGRQWVQSTTGVGVDLGRISSRRRSRHLRGESAGTKRLMSEGQPETEDRQIARSAESCGSQLQPDPKACDSSSATGSQETRYKSDPRTRNRVANNI